MTGLTVWGRPELREQSAHRGLVRQAGATARFATSDETLSPRWRYVQGEPTILLGHHQGQPVGPRRDDRHMLTIAGSRGGKGVSLIVPNLVLWPGSCLVLDPKGELARMTARARRVLHGQEVVVLDPFGVSGQPCGSINPLDALDIKSKRLPADLALLAESTILADGKLSNADHWAGGGRELWTGLTLFAKAYFDDASLVTVRELLAGKYGTVAGSMERPGEIFAAMLESLAFNGLLRRLAIQWLEINPKEQSSILSTARRQTFWLDGLDQEGAAMAKVCASSGVSLADLKRKPLTIYLCLPASDMHSHRAWLRIFVNMAMAALEMTPAPAGSPPVLLLLDEFASLGHMPSLEKAAGLLAGAGVKLWPILQDLGQLKATYGDSWGTFIGNAGVTTFHALGGDEATAEYVSKRLGTTQYQEEQKPGGAFLNQASTGLLRGAGQWVTAPLLYPHECEQAFARETGRLLAFSPGAPPLALDRYDIRSGFLKEWIDD